MGMLDKNTLKTITDKLTEEKARLEGELNQFADKTAVADDFNARLPQYGDKEDENAAEVATYADNLSLERALEKELRDVNSALKLIAEGKYGLCKYCSQAIEVKRLLARPTSTSCVACKKTLTQEL